MVAVSWQIDDEIKLKEMMLDYIDKRSPVVGTKSLLEISSNVPLFHRHKLLAELVLKGEILEIQLSNHLPEHQIFIRKDTRFEVSAKHCSVRVDSYGYHRIGHGTER